EGQNLLYTVGRFQLEGCACPFRDDQMRLDAQFFERGQYAHTNGGAGCARHANNNFHGVYKNLYDIVCTQTVCVRTIWVSIQGVKTANVKSSRLNSCRAAVAAR